MKRDRTALEQPRSLPEIFYDEDLLVPLKCDVTLAGARFVDSVSWNLYRSMMTTDEFAARTCTDLNLPAGFQNKISMQLSEQISAYRDLVDVLHRYTAGSPPKWAEKVKEPQLMTIGIRHNTLDYSDKFYWDLTSSDVSPEKFAKTTCSDFGLPSDMEPAISHKIRETIFRLACTWAEDPKTLELVQSNKGGAGGTTGAVGALGGGGGVEIKSSEIKLSLVSQHSAIEMLNNLWKRAKPAAIDDVATIPQPMLPANKDCNSIFWRKV